MGSPMTQLLNQTLRGTRGLVRLRQRTRQLTRALGFAPRDQALIAAAVFQLGCGTLDRGRGGRVAFHLGEGKLHATSPDAAGPGGVHLEWPLPRREAALDAIDLAWALQQLEQLTPLDLFEEFRQMNLDLLQALNDLQACRSELGKVRRGAA
jgi:hypothetical protein